MAPWAHESWLARGLGARMAKPPGSGFRLSRPCSFSTPTSASLLPAVSPNTELARLALISRKGTVPLGCPGRSRSFPAARPGQAGRCLPHVPRFLAAPRPGTAPPRVTVRAGESLPPPHRLPTWGTCREMPGRGGFLSVARLLSGAGGCGRRAPPPGSGRHHPALQMLTAANGRRGGGPAGGCHPPGDGSAEIGSARAAAAPRAVGEEPREEEEEEPPSSYPRTTARPGSGGPTPAPRLPPRVPDRKHDRRAAPGLLLH